MKNIIAILVPSLESRVDNWHNLLEALSAQIKANDLTDEIKIISNVDNGSKSIGQKRNELIDDAVAGGFEYVAFFDDDDSPGDEYISEIWNGAKFGYDVVSLRGQITTDGGEPFLFEHSIKYQAYRTVMNDHAPIRYERYPNHLNCMILSVAKLFKFPETNHGEDTNFATQVFKSGLLRRECFSRKIIYFYKYKSNK